MSSLSFVALSMQTTQLDPATVSQAAYLKMVDGQVTRRDNILIIPPTSEAQTDSPSNAVDWPEALSQLGMVIGRLPIVSYYRDADKEIFQAASRRSGTELPSFRWLDCRALARELLPELQDHQPSTVLQALGRYDEHADDGTVEQTAQIVLQLAQDHGATTVRQLWGDLYDQPDDLLDLEATLTGLSSSETYPLAEHGVSEHQPPKASGLPASDREHQPLRPQAQSSADTGEQDVEQLTAETGLAAETTMGTESMNAETPGFSDTPEERASESSGSRPYSDSVVAADVEAGTEDLGDSTAQSVIASENLEQPEFLKAPDAKKPHHDELSELHHKAPASETVLEAAEADESVPEPPPGEVEMVVEGDEMSETQTPEPQTPAPQADQLAPTVENEPSETDSPEVTEPTPPQPSATTKPFDPVYQVITPAAVPRPGSRGSASSTTTDLVETDARPSPTQGSRKASARTARVWGTVGMVVFGVLTLAGAILTVMAILLFFTANTLLMETKIAGVVLTGAITLLSLLMATLSYRTYHRK